MKREAAIYRLYVLPPEFQGGSFLPFDRGLVTLTQFPTADFKWVLFVHAFGRKEEVDEQGCCIHPAEQLREPLVVRFDHYGFMIDGKGARTGTHWRWRLEPLRPGVGEWREMFEKQEESMNRPVTPIGDYFVDAKAS